MKISAFAWCPVYPVSHLSHAPQRHLISTSTNTEGVEIGKKKRTKKAHKVCDQQPLCKYHGQVCLFTTEVTRLQARFFWIEISTEAPGQAPGQSWGLQGWQKLKKSVPANKTGNAAPPGTLALDNNDGSP